jgi:hypothetical protein
MRSGKKLKQGKHFRIPEGPADIERLWREGRSLELEHLPPWLSPETASCYRLASGICTVTASQENGNGMLAEIEELELAGLVVERKNGLGSEQVYVSSPAYTDIWSIGIYAGDSPLTLHPADGANNPVITRDDVTDVPAVFVADPFMLKVNQTWHMFFEVMNWRTNKGEIGLASSADGLNWTYQQIVLAEPFHLSYPHVFEWSGDYYMIPESHQAGSIRLYKAREFPTEWDFVGDILVGPYFVDSSIFRHEERWWLFTETNPDLRHDTLRLYHADKLTGPWLEHPLSPVVKGNGTRARPAGRVSVVDDKIIRYAQSCYPSYGSKVRAFAVTELTTTTYREHQIHHSPILEANGAGWNAGGMHHLDAHAREDGTYLACVDGWRDLMSVSKVEREDKSGLQQNSASLASFRL